jgi:cytochrome c oxidase subunit IV
MTASRARWVGFVALALLTAASLAIHEARLPPSLATPLLLALALGNAALVVATSMHLAAETRALRLAFLVPLALPALFAVILVVEAASGTRGP